MKVLNNELKYNFQMISQSFHVLPFHLHEFSSWCISVLQFKTLYSLEEMFPGFGGLVNQIMLIQRSCKNLLCCHRVYNGGSNSKYLCYIRSAEGSFKRINKEKKTRRVCRLFIWGYCCLTIFIHIRSRYQTDHVFSVNL